MLQSLRIGPEKNFCYLVLCTRTGEAALVDPAFEPERVARWAQKVAVDAGVELKMKYLVATHGHWDHAGGFKKLREIYPDAKVVSGEADEDRVNQLGSQVDIKLLDQQSLTVGDVLMKAIHTPGHTAGGCCFLINDNLLTGDTLFVDQCGRTDLPGGSDEKLYESLQKLKTLPGYLTIYPGHDYGPVPFAKLEEQMKTNPSLQVKDLDSFKKLP